MKFRSYRFPLIVVVGCTVSLMHVGLVRAAAPEFNRDIRPILSENCFFCHGQDPKHREAKLRLDLPEQAMRDLGGYAAIVPGRPEKSEVIKRLTSRDPDERMPPADSNRKVTAAQVETIRRWIAAGAVYQKHWAFEPPKRAELPAVTNGGWPRNGIDRFVLARLEAENLTPSKEAAPEKWLRRASFDLTGIPPTPTEIDAFLADVRARGEAAYGAAVDRLLASERFGERQAIEWMDAARYADTHGFNNDSARTMWRWRDWVIDAFNANKPYDQFITEQLAGDLLPNATVERRLATGFGRNHVINSEGGIIDEEYRVEYVADRVRTMSMAWLGLTMECCRCHDHKFDPLTQRDYYRLFAFFNNVPELGEDGRVANAVPLMAAPTKAQARRLAEQERELAEIDGRLKSLPTPAAAIAPPAPPADASFAVDAETVEPKAKLWSFPGHAPALAPGVRGMAWRGDGSQALAKFEPAAFVLNGKAGATVSFWLNADDASSDQPILSNLNHLGSPADAGYGKGTEIRLVAGEIEFRASDRYPAYATRVRSVGARITAGQWRHVAVTFTPPNAGLARVPASAVRMFVDGGEVPTEVLSDGLSGTPGPQPWLVGADNAKDGVKLRGLLDEWRSYPRALSPAEVHAIFAADAVPFAQSRLKENAASALEKNWLRDAAFAADPVSSKLIEQLAALWQDHLALRRELPLTMVMTDMPQPRPAAILVRGAYDHPGERVEPGVPESLLGPWPKDAPHNRLGLAKWLTQPEHPLTARVVVNRFWAQLFGAGIVKTVEDFGSQGEWPSHPELLDYLARQFVDRGWDTKALLRSIVLSATYRQDSDVTPALLERDPENRLLARGPRVRLPAELIRDQALAVAGLLKQRLGGPSVYPYQPADLYKGVVVGANYPGTTWPTSQGDDLYRRSLYTFWKRTAPHPAMLTFDMPDREYCTVRRSRTNTPLQALTLMNEPGMVEAARQLAARMIREGGADDDARVAFAFRLATGRRPDRDETRTLTRMWTKYRTDFAADPAAATALLKVGASKADETIAPAELAAATMVATTILNLDETMTKD